MWIIIVDNTTFWWVNRLRNKKATTNNYKSG